MPERVGERDHRLLRAAVGEAVEFGADQPLVAAEIAFGLIQLRNLFAVQPPPGVGKIVRGADQPEVARRRVTVGIVLCGVLHLLLGARSQPLGVEQHTVVPGLRCDGAPLSVHRLAHFRKPGSNDLFFGAPGQHDPRVGQDVEDLARSVKLVVRKGTALFADRGDLPVEQCRESGVGSGGNPPGQRREAFAAVLRGVERDPGSQRVANCR
ncbi:hypothetical protein SDC9_169020 [bioreactor metagenome]|uniref:Uncharacterized protein n=1 Tax=bioreactor metagenome TaxID=1076179 RepID=A0A645G6P6_9ZZZZ